MSKSNHFSIHRNCKRVMASQWPVGPREPKEPYAMVIVVELEFEMFLVRVERDPQIIYLNCFLLGLKETHGYDIYFVFVGLKQIHWKQIETDPCICG